MALRCVVLGAAASVLSAALPMSATAQSAAPSGEAVFRQRCQACHTAVAGQPARVGPNLAGVIGRKAAATPFNYSAALKRSGLTWSRANIDRYLQGPTRMVPGTRMVISLTDAGQRAALITYLAGQK